MTPMTLSSCFLQPFTLCVIGSFSATFRFQVTIVKYRSCPDSVLTPKKVCATPSLRWHVDCVIEVKRTYKFIIYLLTPSRVISFFIS